MKTIKIENQETRQDLDKVISTLRQDGLKFRTGETINTYVWELMEIYDENVYVILNDLNCVVEVSTETDYLNPKEEKMKTTKKFESFESLKNWMKKNDIQEVAGRFSGVYITHDGSPDLQGEWIVRFSLDGKISDFFFSPTDGEKFFDTTKSQDDNDILWNDCQWEII